MRRFAIAIDRTTGPITGVYTYLFDRSGLVASGDTRIQCHGRGKRRSARQIRQISSVIGRYAQDISGSLIRITGRWYGLGKWTIDTQDVDVMLEDNLPDDSDLDSFVDLDADLLEE